MIPLVRIFNTIWKKLWFQYPVVRFIWNLSFVETGGIKKSVMPITLYHTISSFNDLRKKPLKHCWKQEKLSGRVFSFLVTTCSTYQPFTKRWNLRLLEIESICRQQNKCHCKIKICFGKGRKHCGKRRKCWLPAFSPFFTMFSKAFFFRVVKSRDCVVKS